MKNIQLPSTTANLVTASNSILKKYGVAPFHQTCIELDAVLEHHDQVVFILFDGAGTKIIENSCKPNSVLRTRPHIKITSIFPPTTVAATNAFLSGLYPSENGWLGWTQYFSDLGRAFNVFQNVDSWTKELVPGNVMRERYPINNIFHIIAKVRPDVNVQEVMPHFVPGGAKNLNQFYRHIRKSVKTPGPTLVYAYWIEPDSTLHKEGTDSKKIKRIMRQINRKLLKLEKKEPNTLFVVLADHGLTNVKFLNICEHTDFFETLVRPFTLEGRAANFYVKPEMKNQFEQLFHTYYGKYFRLFTKSDAIHEELFGPTPMSDKARVFLGDYIAVAIDDYGFYYSLTNEPKRMKAHHAGTLEAEMSINLTLLNYKK